MSFLVTCPVSSASIFLSSDFKTIRKEGTGGSLSVIFLHGWRKEMPVFCIFLLRLLWKEEASPPQGQAGFECGDSEQFQALVEESGLLLFPHVCLPLSCPLHWKEAIVLFSSAHILMTWLTEPSRRKCKWPTWAYVQDSLLKPRGGIYFQSNLLVAPPEGDE